MLKSILSGLVCLGFLVASQSAVSDVSNFELHCKGTSRAYEVVLTREGLKENEFGIEPWSQVISIRNNIATLKGEKPITAKSTKVQKDKFIIKIRENKTIHINRNTGKYKESENVCLGQFCQSINAVCKER
ncbi:MAG: hypothetical protein HOJ67_16865 [Rhodospirillaceae bacterium]|jgi:hypothetical protein|nr:hypothetical protein [Rhodospirillaceae bacterium]MBT6218198.1 hypothetical protein [Rhodospirillaceae bacterium]MBT6363874.1 hypothetical protein [Rhodospirillaceae bacterium]